MQQSSCQIVQSLTWKAFDSICLHILVYMYITVYINMYMYMYMRLYYTCLNHICLQYKCLYHVCLYYVDIYIRIFDVKLSNLFTYHLPICFNDLKVFWTLSLGWKLVAVVCPPERMIIRKAHASLPSRNLRWRQHWGNAFYLGCQNLRIRKYKKCSFWSCQVSSCCIIH